MSIRFLRFIFKILNRFFMVPCFRMGLGPFLGTPVGGYVMVLKTTGNKTGKTRFAPVNYAIHNGSVYCLAGFGKRTHWYRNLQYQPNIEMLLPGRSIAGRAEDATGSPEAPALYRQILKNSGFASFLAGINPFSISDTKLSDRVRPYRLVRIRPTGIGAGPADAGGWFWLLLLLLTLILFWIWLR